MSLISLPLKLQVHFETLQLGVEPLDLEEESSQSLVLLKRETGKPRNKVLFVKTVDNHLRLSFQTLENTSRAVILFNSAWYLNISLPAKMRKQQQTILPLHCSGGPGGYGLCRLMDYKRLKYLSVCTFSHLFRC